jgi:hypothetical protein
MSDFLILSGEQTRQNNFDLVIDEIKKHSPKEILFWCGMEYYPNGRIEHLDYVKLNSVCSDIGTIFYFIFSTKDEEFYKKDVNFNLSNIKILFFPTHLLHHTYSSFIDNNKNIEIIKPEFDKIFLNFNGKPHYHRCLTVDKLFEHDLVKYGKVSWNSLKGTTSDGTYVTHSYEFKFWEEKIMKADNYSGFEITSDILEPRTFMSVVSESTEDLFFVTEKTFRSLLIGQIFYCIGGKGQNLKLKEFGFQLYDEIFDYSLDLENSIEQRVNGVVMNIKKLIGADLYSLYNKVLPKIKYNQKLCFEYLRNDPFIPEKIVSSFKKDPSKFYDSGVFHYRTLENLKNKIV